MTGPGTASPASESPASDRIRTSDEERERLATILRAAAEKGMLTLEEVEERLTTVYAARFRDELWPLLADLPNNGRGLAPPVLDPPERSGRRRPLLVHAASVLLIGVALVGIWALTGGGFFWPVWPLAILAFSVLHRAKRRARRRWWLEHRQALLEQGAAGVDAPPWVRHHPGFRHSGYRYDAAAR